MRKRTLLVSFIFILALAYCVNAYAGDNANCPVQGFFHSLGGFLYNALPWNWGNWVGK